MHPTQPHATSSTLTSLSRRALIQSATLAAIVSATPSWAQSKSALPYSVAINRAGKLRALSQRCSKAYIQTALNVMPERAREIALSSQRIIASNLTELVAGQPPADIKKLLQELEKDSSALSSLMASTPRLDGVVEVARVADVMLDSADAVTRAYEGLSGQGSAKIVNLAGRQRMLSQRAARAYFLIAAGHTSATVRKQLDTAKNEFSQSLLALQGAPISTASIRNELDLAKGQWLFYEAALNKSPTPESLQNVATTSERVFEVMDNLTALYDAAVRDLLG